MRLKINSTIVTFFEGEIGKFGTIETGGVLLGKKSDEEILVEKAIGPGPNAIHEQYYFKADANYIDMMIDMEFANSNGQIIYLGEWHTHPQRQPTPSELDLESLAQIADSHEKTSLLMILGSIDFRSEIFATQSISIIKNPLDQSFYKVTPTLTPS